MTLSVVIANGDIAIILGANSARGTLNVWEALLMPSSVTLRVHVQVLLGRTILTCIIACRVVGLKPPKEASVQLDPCGGVFKTFMLLLPTLPSTLIRVIVNTRLTS